MRWLSSVTSSGQPEAIETTSVSSPIESVTSPRPTDEEKPDVQLGLKLSLWLQWTLQKFVVKLYGKGVDHNGKTIGLTGVSTAIWISKIKAFTLIYLTHFQDV